MKIECTHCGAEFDLRKGPVKCPRCQSILVVDAVPDVLDVVDFVEDDEPPSRLQKAPADPTHVVCPICAEKNRTAAKVCRYCGERLRPAERSGVWRDGNKLVMTKDADLPYRCVKTNEPAETLLRRKLSWHSPLIFITILAGLLIYVILAVVLSKKADIQVPISHRIKKRRSMAIVAGWLFGLGGLGVTILTCILWGNSQDPMWRDPIPFVIIGGIVFIVFSALIASFVANIVSPSKITDRHIWLRGVHSDYLNQLPQWPGE